MMIMKLKLMWWQEIVELLLTAVMAFGKKSSMEELVGERDREGQTALHHAVNNGHIQVSELSVYLLMIRIFFIAVKWDTPHIHTHSLFCASNPSLAFLSTLHLLHLNTLYYSNNIVKKCNNIFV